jgi:ArsR family transcriptional regulator, arsenate/arsenite/antimonite-responsive transcriptional repressor
MYINILPEYIHRCQYRIMNLPQLISTCCPSLLSGLINSKEAEQMAAVFRVLGEPARLQLLNSIAAQPTGEACVCQLTEPLGLSQPTVSHHLKVLYEAGLLQKERRGTWIFYRLVPERIEALRNALALPNQKP